MRFVHTNTFYDLPEGERDVAYFRKESWNDWFNYETLYRIIIVDQNGVTHEPGHVKIGEFGLKPGGTIQPGVRTPAVPNEFNKLGEQFFSVGPDENYYETVAELDAGTRPASARDA